MMSTLKRSQFGSALWSYATDSLSRNRSIIAKRADVNFLALCRRSHASPNPTLRGYCAEASGPTPAEGCRGGSCSEGPIRTKWRQAFTEGERTFLLRAITDTFDPRVPVEEAKTPPASWYTSPLMRRLEEEAVFNNNWIAVDAAENCSKPGQFLTGYLGRTPYLIVRGEDGKLRAFCNLCRHRGNHLVSQATGVNTNGTFECSYHGWVYGMDGRLRKTTKMKGIRDFKGSDYSLYKLGVKESAGRIFLHQNPSADKTLFKSVETHIAPLQVPAHTLLGRKVYDVKCNWKVFMDNNLDSGLHVEYVHAHTLGAAYWKCSRTESSEPRKSVEGSCPKDPSWQGGDIYVQEFYKSVLCTETQVLVYPNVLLLSFGDNLHVNTAVPTRGQADSFQLVYDLYVRQSALPSSTEAAVDEERERIYKETMQEVDAVTLEDIDVFEKQQRGLGCDQFAYGRYSPQREAINYDFHRRLFTDFLNYLEA